MQVVIGRKTAAIHESFLLFSLYVETQLVIRGGGEWRNLRAIFEAISVDVTRNREFTFLINPFDFDQFLRCYMDTFTIFFSFELTRHGQVVNVGGCFPNNYPRAAARIRFRKMALERSIDARVVRAWLPAVSAVLRATAWKERPKLKFSGRMLRFWRR